MPRVSSSIVAALDRDRDCSDAFARAMRCGESLAQPPQRGKKTWESEQELWGPARHPHTVGALHEIDEMIFRHTTLTTCAGHDAF